MKVFLLIIFAILNIWNADAQRFTTVVGGGFNLSTMYFQYSTGFKASPSTQPQSGNDGYGVYFQAYMVERFEINDYVSIQTGFKIHKNGSKAKTYNLLNNEYSELYGWIGSLGIPVQVKILPNPKLNAFFVFGVTGSEMYYFPQDLTHYNYEIQRHRKGILNMLTADIGLGVDLYLFSFQTSWHPTLKPIGVIPSSVINVNGELLYNRTNYIQSSSFELNLFINLFKKKKK